MQKLIAGVDIGGTKIAVTIGTSHGKILAKERFSSGKETSAFELIGKIESILSQLIIDKGLRKSNFIGIGVAIPGAVDHKREQVLKSPNLPTWERISLKKIFKQKIGLPIWVENDGNAAALGEQHFGSGRGIDDFIYLTVSTGVGGGIVANGSLLRGTTGTAGEVGHMTIVPNGNLCACGKKGCIEAYSSGTAIANHVKQALKTGAKSKFFKGIKINEVTGQLVCEAAVKYKDPIAIRARELAGDYFGIAIANLINIFNPKRILLGGGVMEQEKYFWQSMMKSVKREAWPMSLKDCDILKSKLGKNVGDLGAVAIVLDALKRP